MGLTIKNARSSEMKDPSENSDPPKTPPRWSEHRLEKLRQKYEKVLQKALSASPDTRTKLIAITRRTRKRLRKLGIILRDRRGGGAQYYEQGHKPEVLDTEKIVTDEIVSYLRRHQLKFGISEFDKPSWAIALNTYRIPPVICDYSIHELPGLIGECANSCDALISQALFEGETLQSNILLLGVPECVRDLWREFSIKRNRLPQCIRPDLFVERSGAVRAFEFNVDLRLDRGIAHGVTEYSLPLIDTQHERFIANNLALSYAAAAKQLVQADVVNGATIHAEGCRDEYNKQEEYFCRELNNVSAVSWKLLNINEVFVDSYSGRLIETRTNRSLDVVMLETELLDNDGHPRGIECKFLESLLSKCDHTRVLGTILPFADKALFALLQSKEGVSNRIKPLLVPTSLLGPEVQLARKISIEEIKNCFEHRQHFVLKKAGIHLDSTGSKSVFICSDMSPELWTRAVDDALRDVTLGKRGWIVQPRVEPLPYRIRYKLKPSGLTRENDCLVRLSMFYMRTHSTHFQGAIENVYSLAGAIATAGTDHQVLKRHLYSIRALRESTYMPVTRAQSR